MAFGRASIVLVFGRRPARPVAASDRRQSPSLERMERRDLLSSGPGEWLAPALQERLMPRIVASAQPAAVAPVVVGVQRFGIHRQPTTLVFTFSTKLDPARAENVHNYIIVDKQGRNIAVTSAHYDSAALTVTLTPSARLNVHQPYFVEVRGVPPTGITSATGTPLNGAGNIGSDYVATLRGPGLLTFNRMPKTSSVVT